jgi:putative protein-disulfide isomerase
MQKAEIIYVFDGYCGWCWGMDAVITRLSENFSDRFSFRALCGGLMVGSRIGPLGDFGTYIERAIPRVEELTGAKFSDAHMGLIRDQTTMQDSRVPAAAFAVIVQQHPDADTMALAHDLLTLNFSEGRDLSKPESYSGIFSKYHTDAPAFATEIRSGKLYPLAEKLFSEAREMDASAFPALVYGREGEYFPLCEGYQPYDNLAHALETLYREPPEL